MVSEEFLRNIEEGSLVVVQRYACINEVLLGGTSPVIGLFRYFGEKNKRMKRRKGKREVTREGIFLEDHLVLHPPFNYKGFYFPNSPRSADDFFAKENICEVYVGPKDIFNYLKDIGNGYDIVYAPFIREMCEQKDL